MSLKGSKTTADYLPWDTMQVLVQRLYKSKEEKFALMIAIGAYTGLRISDIQSLTWAEILESDRLHIVERKTKKQRLIPIHPELRMYIDLLWNQTPLEDSKYIFTNKDGQVFCLQYINRKLKSFNKRYQLNIRFSTHSFRKTFGRRIWEQHHHSEKSLILLSQVFNHSTIAITKRYLGIREQEIKEVYLNL